MRKDVENELLKYVLNLLVPRNGANVNSGDRHHFEMKLVPVPKFKNFSKTIEKV